MEISITILGEPKTQQRHRTFTKVLKESGKMLRWENDPSAKDKKDLLIMAREQAPDVPIEGPISLTLKLHFSRPKTHYRTGKFSNELKANPPVFQISTPDIDNCYKLVSDALATVFYRNDSQICMLQVLKLYSDKPRTEILIETL